MADGQAGGRLRTYRLLAALFLQTFKPEKVKCRKEKCFLLVLTLWGWLAGLWVLSGRLALAEEPPVPAGPAEEAAQGQPCPSVLFWDELSQLFPLLVLPWCSPWLPSTPPEEAMPLLALRLAPLHGPVLHGSYRPKFILGLGGI